MQSFMFQDDKPSDPISQEMSTVRRHSEPSNSAFTIAQRSTAIGCARLTRERQGPPHRIHCNPVKVKARLYSFDICFHFVCALNAHCASPFACKPQGNRLSCGRDEQEANAAGWERHADSHLVYTKQSFTCIRRGPNRADLHMQGSERIQ
jgi:hypothetical protein